MLHTIQQLIQETIKYGTGQAIIAFGAWIYVLILLLVAVYYALLSLMKLFFHH